MPWPRLCEVFYDFQRAAGRHEPLQAISDLARAGVIEDAILDAGVWQAAGTLKANLRRVSLADRMKATILTADHHEFDVLAARPIYLIRFIR